MHHGFTTSQKEIEGLAHESSFKNLATRSNKISNDALVPKSIDEARNFDDNDTNGDKPLRGYTRESVEWLSEDLYEKSYDSVVKEIVDKRERIATSERESEKTRRGVDKTSSR